MTAKITFYFDFVSPHSYVAFQVLKRLHPLWKFELDLRPLALPKLLEQTNNKAMPPAPARMAFIGQDLTLTTQMYGITLNIPGGFMTASTEAANKVAIAARHLFNRKTLTLDHWIAIINAIWGEFYGKGRLGCFTKDPYDLMGPLKETGISSMTIDQLLQLAISGEVAKEYEANCNEALEKGAFGAPTMIISNGEKSRLFFGGDRFHHVAHFINEDPTVPYSEAVRNSKL